MADSAPGNGAPPAIGVTFQLDGRSVAAPAGTMLVDAAALHGVEIPIFCYERRLGAPIGACRMCLVEVEGMRGLQTACSTPVAADLVVRTITPEVKDAQEGVLEMLLANHPLDCPVCDKGGECPLQDRTFRFGPGETRFAEPKRHFPKPLDLSSLIALDRERCITCFRCVRFSQDVAQDRNLIFEERGGHTYIATQSGEEYRGRFTGNVIDLCPVGALTSNPYRFVARPWDIVTTPSVCGHCPVGCNTELTGREGRIMRVTGRPLPNAAVEEGWLCDKGRWAYPATFGPDRLTRALIREPGHEQEVALEEAVERAALLVSRAAAPAFLVGPGATVEEGFLAQELAGALPGGTVGTTGLPGAALSELRALPGADLGDLDTADLVVVLGGNPAQSHPVVELRVRKAARRGAKLLVVGPRPTALDGLGLVVRTDPGRLATCTDPLTDALDSAQAAAVLWDEGDLAFDPDAARRLARLIADRPGARQLELAAEVNGAGLRALGIPSDRMLEDARGNRVGTLVAVHAEPRSWLGGHELEAALGRVGPIVAIASHRSELTDRAAVILPAATHYEQEGVLVSTAGRAQRLRPGVTSPKGTSPAWEILLGLSHRIGKPLPYRTARQVFDGVASRGGAFAGMSYDAMGVHGARIGAQARVPVQMETSPPEGDGLVLVPCPSIFGDVPSSRSDALRAVLTSPEAVVSSVDAERIGLNGDQHVRISSVQGELRLPVRTDPAVRVGSVLVTVGRPGASGAEALLAFDRRPIRVSVARA